MNRLLAKLKRSILMISAKMKGSNKKGTAESKKNIQPPSWGSQIQYIQITATDMKKK